MDTGYILNRRPFRDNSLLVDLITYGSGRITCVARVAKKRGKIMQGTLEPFRLLRLDWIGKGDVQTLTLAEEKGRHKIQVTSLCEALYLNELLLKLIPKHAPVEELFLCYKQSLHHLSDGTASLTACELDILDVLGYSLAEAQNLSDISISSLQTYRYTASSGLLLDDESFEGVPISGKLLIKLNGSSTLEDADQRELRQFLDQFFDILLAGKKLNSRKLAFGY